MVNQRVTFAAANRMEASKQRGSMIKRIAKGVAELLHIHRPRYVYHMDTPADRELLISDLWSGEFEAAIGSLSGAE